MSFSDKTSIWSRLFGKAENGGPPVETGLPEAATTPTNTAPVADQPPAPAGDTEPQQAGSVPMRRQVRKRPARTQRPAPRVNRDTSMPSFSNKPGGGPLGASGAPQMKTLRHSFTPSHPVADSRLFAGRRGLLEKIVSLLEDQHLHLVLFGDRGIGKTSIMRVLADLAKDADYYVSYTSCGKDTDFEPLVRSIAKRIPLLYHADYKPTDVDVEKGSTLESLLHSGPVTVTDATAIFENLKGNRFLFLLDEFDRIGSDKTREQIAELIKNLSDRGVPVQFVIAGVASNLTALFSHIPSIRRNLIGLPVRRLSDEEASDLLDLGAERTDLGFAQDARDLLVRFSHGLPYIAQLLGLHAGIAAIKRGSNTIELADVQNAAQEAEMEIGLRLSEGARKTIENECRDGQFDVLRSLAFTAIGEGEGIPEPKLDLLSEETRRKLISEEDHHFAEEASIPYILLLGRHRDNDLHGADASAGQA